MGSVRLHLDLDGHIIVGEGRHRTADHVGAVKAQVTASQVGVRVVGVCKDGRGCNGQIIIIVVKHIKG